MLFAIDEPEYPQQWTYDAQGRPTCTAFLSYADRDEQVKAMYHKPKTPQSQMALL